MSVPQAPTPPRLPWWRRLFASKAPAAPSEATRTTGKAGTFRSSARDSIFQAMKVRTMIVGIVAGLAAIGLVGYIAVPGFQSSVNGLMGGGPDKLVQNVIRFFNQRFEPVRPNPDGIVATNHVLDNVPARIIDGYSNTEWRANDAQPEVTITLPGATNIDFVIFTSGADKNFTELRRPKLIELEFDGELVETIEIVDTHDPQTFEIKPPGVGVRVITLTIADTYGSPGADVALSEVEFFRRKQ